MFQSLTRYRALVDAIRISVPGILLVTWLLGSTVMAQPSHPAGLARGLDAYSISGIAFDDYNQNGAQDAREPGVNGIVVTAYDETGAVVANTTSATVSGTLGQYSLSIPDGTGPVRVTFSNYGNGASQAPLTLFQPSSHLVPPIQFVDGTQASTVINFGLEIPSEYCQNNPNMATSCYVQGDQTGGAHVVVRFPYDSSGTSVTSPPTPLATDQEVGSTWGLAYRRSSDDLFAAAYTKQLVGYKPSGSTGAIYIIHHANSNTPTVDATPFVDLNALFGANTAGANPHTTTNNYDPDTSSYDAVGKTALGGLAMSDDDSTLYAMNLADRQLYAIPVGAAPGAPTTPTAPSITRTPVPTPADCTASDVRPFAVTAYRGLIYVGEICSAEAITPKAVSKSDAAPLYAYVFVYTPGTGFATTPAFEMPLNYTRHCSNNAFTDPVNCALPSSNARSAWRSWQPDSTQAYTVGAFNDYPQPILSSIAFDNGDLILGLRDRYGDQTGHNVSGLPDGITGGDTVRACLNTAGDLTSGWTLESNGSCGGTTTGGPSNGKGPGNGQFYYQQYYQPYHDYVAMGGLAQVPGFPGVMGTTFDPGSSVFTGGTRTYSNAGSNAGQQTNSYQIYSDTAGTFGKSNGLGDLVAFCQSAPIEIGDRVWVDSNDNGIQDANETGLAGVTVHLYATDGTTLLQTTTTDSTGNYSFTISPYTQYVIKLDNPSDYASGPLLGRQLTDANQDTSNHNTDSKASLPTANQPIGSGNYPQIAVGAHTPGQNDYNQDIGFLKPPDLSLLKSHEESGLFHVGQGITYRLQVSNGEKAGPILVGQPITVTDTIPSGLSYVSATGTNWHTVLVPAGKTMQLTATYTGTDPIAPGDELSVITVNGILTKAALPTLSNTATVAMSLDTNPSNNTTTDTIKVYHAIDVSLSVAHANQSGRDYGCPKVDSTIRYQVKAHVPHSSGPVDMPITVLLALPDGLTYADVSGPNWKVKTEKNHGKTLAIAIYHGHYPMSADTTLPTLTVTGKPDTKAHRLVLVGLVDIDGDSNLDSNPKNNWAHDSVTVCKPPPTLPPTGSAPFIP